MTLFEVADADELALRIDDIDLRQMADHTCPSAGSSGVLGSPRMPITARVLPSGLPVPAEQDHGRCAVAGDVGAGGVDDVREVPLRAGTAR